MRLTDTHLRYWQERQRIPSWVAKIQRGKSLPSWTPPPPGTPRVSIHEIVNLNAGPVKRGAEANTLTLLRSARRLGNLVEFLNSVAENDNPASVRRARWCKKWLVRIFHDDATRLSRTA